MDFTSDGQPFENPDAVANQAYGSIAPSFASEVQSELEEGPVAALGRAAQRGEQAGSSWFDRALVQTGQANAGMVVTPPEPSPTMTAAEANQKYAPPGTTITDKPMSEGLARVIGEQKQAELERNAGIGRYRDAHSWPANFGTGLAAFLLDPGNSATMLVPGLGEDAILGGVSRLGLGTGIAARTLARLGAGATAGAAGQVPLTGLRHSLGGEEASDYGIRDAARDMLFAAAGGALFHAGLGTALHETGLLGSDATMRAAAELDRRAVNVSSETERVRSGVANPATNHAAMSSAASQMLDGRPVDVAPVFDAAEVESLNRMAPVGAQDVSAALADVRYARSAAPQEGTLFDAMRELGGVQGNGEVTQIMDGYRAEPFKRRVVSESGLSPDAMRSALQERGWFGATEDRFGPNALEAGKYAGDDLQDLYDLMEREARGTSIYHPTSVIEAELVGRRGLDEELTRAGVTAGDSDALAARKLADFRFEYGDEGSRQSPADVAEAQMALYRDGYTPGLSAGDLEHMREAIYGRKEAPAAAARAPQGEEVRTPQEADLADLENRWRAVAGQASLTDEERAGLGDTENAVKAARDREQGLSHAAGCLKEAGI